MTDAATQAAEATAAAANAANANAAYRAANGLPVDATNTTILNTPASQQYLAQQDLASQNAKYAAAIAEPRNDVRYAPQAALDAYAQQQQNSIGSGGAYRQPTAAPAAANPYNPNSAAGIAYDVGMSGGNASPSVKAQAAAEGYVAPNNPLLGNQQQVAATRGLQAMRDMGFNVASDDTVIGRMNQYQQPDRSTAPTLDLSSNAPTRAENLGYTQFDLNAMNLAQQRSGYSKNLGDSRTLLIQQGLGAMQDMGFNVANPNTLNVLNLQRNAARQTPSTIDDRFYMGELQKGVENYVETSSAYHHMGLDLGVPIPANRFEYQGDLAVELLKGAPQKAGDWFSPASGEMSQSLVGGEGLQQYAWRGARDGINNIAGVDFSAGINKLLSAEGQYGPYNILYGAPGYRGTPSSQQGINGVQSYQIAALPVDYIPFANAGKTVGLSSGLIPAASIGNANAIAPASEYPQGYGGFGVIAAGNGVNSVEKAGDYGLPRPFTSVDKSNPTTNYTFRSDPLAVVLEGSVYLGDALTGLVSGGSWKPGASLLAQYDQNANPSLDTFNSKMAGLQSQQGTHDALGTKIASEKSDISGMISGKINSEGKFTGTPEEYAKYQSALGVLNSDVSTKYNEFSTQSSSILAEGYKSGAIISTGNGGYTTNPDNDRTYGAFSDWNRGLGRGIQSLLGQTPATASEFSAYEQTSEFKNASPVMQFGEGAYKILATDPASLGQSATQALAIYAGMGALGVGASALAPAEGVAAVGIPQTIGALGVKTLASPIFQYGTGALFVGVGAGEATGWGTLPSSQAASNLGGFSTHMAAMGWVGLAPEGLARGYDFGGSSINPMGIIDRASPIGIRTTQATGVDAATTILYAKVPFSASESGGYPVASIVRESPIRSTLKNAGSEISGDTFTNTATRIPSQQEAMVQANQAVNAGPQTYVHATPDVTPFMSKGSIEVSPKGEGGMFFSGQPGIVYENFLSGNLNGVREAGAKGTPGIVRLTAQPKITPEYMAAINELQATPLSGRSQAMLGVATAKLPSGLYPGLTGYGGVEIPGRAVLSEMVVPGGSKLYVNKVSWEMTPSGEKIPAIDVSFESPGVVTRGTQVVQSILP